MKIAFVTHLSTFGSKVFLTLKIMDFENVVFQGGRGTFNIKFGIYVHQTTIFRKGIK
jgi:hypothetical protein